jgi:hypothetical protein
VLRWPLEHVKYQSRQVNMTTRTCRISNLQGQNDRL